MRNLVFALLLLGCGGTGPKETCTNNACLSGTIYQLCTSGTSQVRYVLGGTSCTCGATSCSDCLTLLSSYCHDGGTTTSGTTTSGTTTSGTTTSGTTTSGTTTSGTTTSGTTGGGSTGGNTSGSSGGTTGNACGQAGDICGSNADCCGGVACTSGFCGGPDGQCKVQAMAGCNQCCIDAEGAGYQEFGVLVLSCLCDSSTCMTQCAATSCSSAGPMPPDSACNSCYNMKCFSKVRSECFGDATCLPYANCAKDCPTM
jgi:hypothetical protein